MQNVDIGRRIGGKVEGAGGHLRVIVGVCGKVEGYD